MLMRPGKSVLCANLVQLLKLEGKTVTLFYFCNNYRSSETNNLAAVLRSFCAQLLCYHEELSYYLFDEFLTKGVSPTWTNLLRAMRTMLVDLKNVRIVIDGVDEWDTASVKTLVTELSRLINLVTDAGASHKLIISSRDVSQISRILAKKPTVSLTEEKSAISVAIRTYITASISEIRNQLFDDGDSSILRELEDLEDELVKKSDGTYVRLPVPHAIQVPSSSRTTSACSVSNL